MFTKVPTLFTGLRKSMSDNLTLLNMCNFCCTPNLFFSIKPVSKRFFAWIRRLENALKRVSRELKTKWGKSTISHLYCKNVTTKLDEHFHTFLVADELCMKNVLFLHSKKCESPLFSFSGILCENIKKCEYFIEN